MFAWSLSHVLSLVSCCCVNGQNYWRVAREYYFHDKCFLLHGYICNTVTTLQYTKREPMYCFCHGKHFFSRHEPVTNITHYLYNQWLQNYVSTDKLIPHWLYTKCRRMDMFSGRFSDFWFSIDKPDPCRVQYWINFCKCEFYVQFLISYLINIVCWTWI